MPALKSTSPNSQSYWAHQRGLQSEQTVINHYRRQQHELLRQRVKTPFAEVDLLFRSPQGNLVLVEVKSANSEFFYSVRISKNQKQRLIRAAAFLSDRFSCLVEVNWAFVSFDEVTVVDDITE